MNAEQESPTWRTDASRAMQRGAQASVSAARWIGQQAASGLRWARSGWRVPVEGAQHLKHGAAIVAVNHLSGQDAARLRGSLSRKITVLANGGGARQSAGRAELEQRALTVLAAGELVGVFPEGAPSPDGMLGPGDAELARLAIRAQVPIIPAAFRQVDDELGRHLILTIGEPIDITRQAKLPELSSRLDMIVLRGITDQVMLSIAQLSGQRYRDGEPAFTGPQVGDLSDLQLAAEQEFERMRDEMIAAERAAMAAAEAEEDELMAAVEAARRQAERAARRDQR